MLLPALLLLIKHLSSIAHVDADAHAVAADQSTAVVAGGGVKRVDPDHQVLLLLFRYCSYYNPRRRTPDHSTPTDGMFRSQAGHSIHFNLKIICMSFFHRAL